MLLLLLAVSSTSRAGSPEDDAGAMAAAVAAMSCFRALDAECLAPLLAGEDQRWAAQVGLLREGAEVDQAFYEALARLPDADPAEVADLRSVSLAAVREHMATVPLLPPAVHLEGGAGTAVFTAPDGSTTTLLVALSPDGWRVALPPDERPGNRELAGLHWRNADARTVLADLQAGRYDSAERAALAYGLCWTRTH